MKKRTMRVCAVLLLISAMMAITFTNDLFTAYVFIEISTIGACSIVMIKGKGESLVETMRYLIMYLIESIAKRTSASELMNLVTTVMEAF